MPSPHPMTVAQASLELVTVFLPQPSKGWDYRCETLEGELWCGEERVQRVKGAVGQTRTFNCLTRTSQADCNRAKGHLLTSDWLSIIIK